MTKTILITGASSGIGKAAALYFQKQGWQVAATMRQPEKDQAFQKLNNVICPKLDVTKDEDIKSAFKQTIDKFGQIDVVVNNAGYGLVGPFEATGSELIKKQFNTNVFGLMKICQEIIPHFKKQGRGTIINISSIGGLIAFPYYGIYNSTKWAVEGFSEGLWFELKQRKIKVKIVEPGVIKTNFYNYAARQISAGAFNECQDKVCQKEINETVANLKETFSTGDSAEAVAKIIYKAATDKSWRLRYPAGKHARLILTLRKILPYRLFNAILEKFF